MALRGADGLSSLAALSVEHLRSVLEAADQPIHGVMEVGGQQALQQARLELEIDLEGQLRPLRVILEPPAVAQASERTGDQLHVDRQRGLVQPHSGRETL